MGRSTTYTDEFRQTIVELWRSGKKVRELSDEYGIPTSTLKEWVRKEKPIVQDDGNVITAEEYKKLLKKLAKLEEENEILKKVTAIFAKK